MTSGHCRRTETCSSSSNHGRLLDPVPDQSEQRIALIQLRLVRDAVEQVTKDLSIERPRREPDASQVPAIVAPRIIRRGCATERALIRFLPFCCIKPV